MPVQENSAQYDQIVFESDEFNVLYGDLVKIHRKIRDDRPDYFLTNEFGLVIEQLLEKQVRGRTYPQSIID